MKKLILASLVLIVSTHGFSQGLMKALVSRTSFGLKAGVNYSNYTNADFNTDALVGFHAGAMVNFKLIENLSIQEEFLFSSQGAKVKGNVFSKEDVQVYYLTVPFLLKYRTNFGLYIEGGVQAGMRLKDFTDSTQMGSFAKKLDLAAAGGIGYQSKSGFGIGVRYVAGLSKVGDFQVSKINPDFKTSVVQASIFYIF
jgi:hypothetical protein